MVDNPFLSESAKREEQLRTGQTTLRGEEVGGEIIKTREEIEREVQRRDATGSRVRRTTTTTSEMTKPEAVSPIVIQPKPPVPTVSRPKPISQLIIESQLEQARLAAQRGVSIETLEKETKSPLKALEQLGSERKIIEQTRFETGSPISVVQQERFVEGQDTGVREKFLQESGKKAELFQRESIKQIDKFAQREPLVVSPFEAVTKRRTKVSEISERVIRGAARGVSGVARTVVEKPLQAGAIAGVATGIGAALTLLPEPVTTAAGLGLLGVVGAVEGTRIATSEQKLEATGESVARLSATGLLLAPFVKAGGVAARTAREIVFPQTPKQVTGLGFELPKGTREELITQRLGSKQIAQLGKQPRPSTKFPEFIETQRTITESRALAQTRAFDFAGRPDFQPSATVQRTVTERVFPSAKQFDIVGQITEKGFVPLRQLRGLGIGKRAQVDIGFRGFDVGLESPSVTSPSRPSSLFGFSAKAFSPTSLTTPAFTLAVPVLPTRPGRSQTLVGDSQLQLGDIRDSSITKQLEKVSTRVSELVTPTVEPTPQPVTQPSVGAGLDIPSLPDVSLDTLTDLQTGKDPIVGIPVITPVPISSTIGGLPGGFLFGGGGRAPVRRKSVKRAKKRPTRSISQAVFGATGVGVVQRGRSEITGLALRR